ncbi:hypothetical protein U732_1859 [Clostridium argentinense CDC 2741]|uniref:Uncharacterized protein n=1 Tax=Clostridium argentinense CDC 2741 TaxID=1418104 RepID=A0A0C1U0R2_9CLOT|nr:hypothetical protein [Clostridium argentinense]ARC85926.1 hypothetical protein RSJ17_16210 [Clostridium argentinense]KIE46419.1 hypothetical protein U732_1859 [Clostridium argentinense CDC 2741]NFF38855.1 hypothetical protein [Clostridium argentinense]NFP48647.1 hypothetical protein [Clostridium argentinense]NFP71085.1 hypothetical protein [Clostridium argentinense]
MEKFKDAIERIKILQCPTGDVENRVAGILEDYGVANKKEITVNRNEELDSIGAEAYSVQIGGNKESIVVLARSGKDDYVAEVVGVYMN